MTKNMFGEFFKNKRIELGLALRQFCEKYGLDPGNISRLERGLLPPPESREKLEEYARYLNLKKGSDDWYQFFDLAAAAKGHIPEELMKDEEIVAKLPTLFRMLRGNKVADKKLDELIKKIKES